MIKKEQIGGDIMVAVYGYPVCLSEIVPIIISFVRYARKSRNVKVTIAKNLSSPSSHILLRPVRGRDC